MRGRVSPSPVRRPEFARLAALTLLVLALVFPPVVSADVADEKALAERYAPVVRLVEQEEECGPGEPYEPLDVDVLFGEPTVALRGPWSPADLVKIGPAASDLVNRYEYHLDFPGNALEPGCDYERWGRRLASGSFPTVYAHVAPESGHPGSLALQYWLFYAFNDFNNKHEGDWEMIQLVFDAENARQALSRKPVEIGYSSHEGAERAAWDDEKLDIAGETHPVVYPAAGSHANKFSDALYLGSSAEAGVGCDDTRGPHRELRPVVKTITSDASEARKLFPWIAFEGRWGELQPAFFNGPTGPNLKRQWTEPIGWSEGWRARSYAVPVSGVFGTGATDFFCGAVASGSRGLIWLVRNPALMIALIAFVLLLLAFATTRTTWRPVAPLRVARRRSWGQVVSASGRMYVRRAPLFLGIGLLLIPMAFAITFLQWLVFTGFELAGSVTGESAGASAFLGLVIGTALTFIGLGLVQAATVCALVQIDEGQSIGPIRAYRLALERIRSLLGALGIVVLVWLVLTSTGILLPVAIWIVVWWSLLAPVVVLEGHRPVAALRRSGRLVRGRWFRVASLVGLGAAIALLTGPLLGALLIFATDAPFGLLNLVAGVVFALAMPFVALTTAYVYFDARVREELASERKPGVLPAEIELSA